MSLWYYLEKGVPKGPVRAEELIERVRQGQIGPSDLVYKEKGLKWEEARLCSDFAPYFEAKTHDVEKLNWVILAKKPDGKGYKQKGPFLTAQVRAMLSSGEVTLSDFAWRDGFKEWYKIISLPDLTEPPKVKKQLPNLSGSRATPNYTQTPHQKKVAEGEAKVFELKRTETKSNVESEADPDWMEKTAKIPLPETVDDDKTEVISRGIKGAPSLRGQKNTFVHEETERFLRRPTRDKKKPSIVAIRVSFVNWFLELSAVRKAGVIACVCMFAGASVFFLSYFSSRGDVDKLVQKPPKVPVLGSNVPVSERRKGTTPEPAAQTSAVTNSIAVPTQNASAQAVPEAKVEEKKAPTYIRMNVKGAGTDGTLIYVDTDGTRHYPIIVELYSDPGDSLGYKSFSRTWTLKKMDDREINLKERKVPYGVYQVQMKMEDKIAKGEVAFGTTTKDYLSSLRLARKKIVYDSNDERYAFVKVASRLEKQGWKLVQAADAVSGGNAWKNFYKDWRKDFDRINSSYFKSVSVRNRNDYVHGRKWMELKALRDLLSTQARDLNKARLNSTTFDKIKLRETVSNTQKIHDYMISFSLFK